MKIEPGKDWKDTKITNILEKHETPPKGFKPQIVDNTLSIRDKSIPYQHILITPEEAYDLFYISHRLGIKGLYKKDHIPFNVEFSFNGNIIIHIKNNFTRQDLSTICFIQKLPRQQ